MNRSRQLLLIASTVFVLASLAAGIEASDRLPNVVIVFIDDMGYADIGPFGSNGYPNYPTPELDRMAKEGRPVARPW